MPPTLRSSNPVFSNNRAFGTAGRVPSPGDLQSMYDTPARMTVDDVILHTIGLLSVLGVTGAVGWVLVPGRPGVALGSGLAALALSLVIAFSRTTNPVLITAFAVLEGLFVGAISRIYENLYSGIVVQALIGTGAVFVGMLVAYRSGRLRATPRMRKIVFGSLLGIVGVGLVDLVLRVSTGSHLPILNDASPLGILLSVGILVVAALQFILDFDYIEQAIAAGVPRREAWRAAYGLLIGFVWVYLELLRLLGKLRR
ncbi:MAG: Bax inhibitor-1/YccA family protein [Actinomycetota bacterium]|nr:Bax inhibitor-1/YccA family protein [Actinomycetota bacterium]